MRWDKTLSNGGYRSPVVILGMVSLWSILKVKPLFFPRVQQQFNNINIAFVGNIWIKDINKDKKLLGIIEEDFARSIYEIYKKDLPDSFSRGNITSTIRPTFCVISDLVKYCKNDINNGYTKRYGDIFFDIIREINRYQKPSVLRTTKKYSKRVKNEIKEYTNEEIIKMFEIEIPK